MLLQDCVRFSNHIQHVDKGRHNLNLELGTEQELSQQSG